MRSASSSHRRPTCSGWEPDVSITAPPSPSASADRSPVRSPTSRVASGNRSVPWTPRVNSVRWWPRASAAAATWRPRNTAQPRTRMRMMCNLPVALWKAVLERALDARVECVEPVERERLRRPEAAVGRGVGPVVGEHAVQEREPALGVEPFHSRLEQLVAEDEMPEQAALLGQLDRRAVGELARLAEVVHEGGADQQV